MGAFRENGMKPELKILKRSPANVAHLWEAYFILRFYFAGQPIVNYIAGGAGGCMFIPKDRGNRNRDRMITEIESVNNLTLNAI